MPCNAAAPKGPAFWFLKLLLFRLFRVREGIEFPTMVGYVGGNAIFPPPHRGAVPLAPCTGLALLRSLRTHTQRRYRHSTPQPCGTRATFLLVLVLDLCPLSFFGRHFISTSSSSSLRHALPRQLARTPSAARLATPARARAPSAHERRPATNDTTCGPPEWLTGKLQQGGTRSVRSPPRRPPLLATPIATPLQGGRPERSDLLFLKLLVEPETVARPPPWPEPEHSTTSVLPTILHSLTRSS